MSIHVITKEMPCHVCYDLTENKEKQIKKLYSIFPHIKLPPVSGRDDEVRSLVLSI